MSVPLHDTPILGMVSRPPVESALQYGFNAAFWVEYSSGLVDLTCKNPLKPSENSDVPPPKGPGEFEFAVDGGRTLRVDANATALVVIDMQNFFLHPDLRDHPLGLKCVDPLLRVVPTLREKGVKILWVNWGLTVHELKTLPPALIRGFRKPQSIRGGGFGSELPGDFGRLLMRGERNSDLYGPLQDEYVKGQKAGTDFWVHKNRMSALWDQTALDLSLKEHGLRTLLFAGVNTDQCVGGTLIDAYYRGYDCIVLQDATATTSPSGGFENVIYNAGNSYGFVTDTGRVIAAQ
ncbi:Isochorismatase hydrolase [Marasmius fiardii PR-910]|nr:Isochorismatase hydrolase [Marasmius fiardii PR-910]